MSEETKTETVETQEAKPQSTAAASRIIPRAPNPDLTGTLNKLQSSNQDLREQNRLLLEQNNMLRSANEKMSANLKGKEVHVPKVPKDRDYFDSNSIMDDDEDEDEEERE